MDFLSYDEHSLCFFACFVVSKVSPNSFEVKLLSNFLRTVTHSEKHHLHIECVLGNSALVTVIVLTKMLQHILYVLIHYGNKFEIHLSPELEREISNRAECCISLPCTKVFQRNIYLKYDSERYE